MSAVYKKKFLNNRKFATALREKANTLPDGAGYKYALITASCNIANHLEEIHTETDARKVQGVGPKIVEELLMYGLEPSTSKRDRSFIEGADAVRRPNKQQRGDTAMRQLPTSTEGLQQNSAIARVLLNIAKEKEDGFQKGLQKAAMNIQKWPTEIKTVQQCFEVPGVSTHITKLIMTEALQRDITEEEQAFLQGAEMQAGRLGSYGLPC